MENNSNINFNQNKSFLENLNNKNFINSNFNELGINNDKLREEYLINLEGLIKGN